MDQEHDAFHIQFERTDDKLALYPLFPFRPLAGTACRVWLAGVWVYRVFVRLRFNNFKNGKSITT